ncbi:disease resistance protein At4g27190-like [Prunus avium]|uniref:Disease resistance protein At4g27190-like n=1 Tax=Prunus avium TaxID=42229 RepID=A0A6P5S4V3_PRUAV|nr:disease resistance protein At4g27190-like [Prunus avium]
MTVDRVVDMKQVSKEEAWKLFREQVGELVDSPEIQPYARIIVEECGGLPLLIIVTGRALAGVNEASVWEDATREFVLPSTPQIYDVEAVVQRMKFSYGRLKAYDIKSCFLYCALFSEDREVDISELVKCCIQEGLISGNWSEAYQRGHDIVKTLVGASLLQSTNGGLAIKMHDVVRDLASAIMSGAEGLQFMLRLYSRSTESLNLGTNPSYKPIESPESNRSIPEGCGFLLEGGVGLRELPPKREQWERGKIIALMDNERLPENPSSPNLLVLFLERNRRLRVIPSSFFDSMPCLSFLNLSKTRINCLPQSISKLKRLQFLILRDCDCLVELPSEVGSLGKLEVLDLRGTEINSLPNEICRLASLRYLEVCFYGSISPNEYAYLPHELFSVGIVSTLFSLETLSIGVYPGDQRWNKSIKAITMEVCSLKILTSLNFCFPEVELLDLFLRTCPKWNDQLLTKFKFVVGYDVKRIVSRVPSSVEFDYNQHGRCLRFVNVKIVPHVVCEVLARTTAFYLDHHLSMLSLFEFGVGNINGLKLCIVSECPRIQSIIDGNKLAETVFPSLEYLSIQYLRDLERIWKGNIPYGSFSKLRILLVHSCPKLEFVFTSSMLPFVSNLEELVVEDCPAVEVIVLHQDDIMDSEIVLLSSLKKLTLHHLPRLFNIWEGAWPSLECISFYKCRNLKKLGMDSKLKYSLKEIKAEKHWWDALQWDGSSLFLDLEAHFIPV